MRQEDVSLSVGTPARRVPGPHTVTVDSVGARKCNICVSRHCTGRTSPRCHPCPTSQDTMVRPSRPKTTGPRTPPRSPFPVHSSCPSHSSQVTLLSLFTGSVSPVSRTSPTSLRSPNSPRRGRGPRSVPGTRCVDGNRFPQRGTTKL